MNKTLYTEFTVFAQNFFLQFQYFFVTDSWDSGLRE